MTDDAQQQRIALAERINDALPQTQCTRCGYPDCAAYARAIAHDEAAINQCPPGGQQGIAKLAHITGLPVLALNPACGTEKPRAIAIIKENWCIGCALCLRACPTDAILGGHKRMHTVITQWCTGCELCIPACPVDCIVLQNASDTRTGWNAWGTNEAQWARERYARRQKRFTGAQRNKHMPPQTTTVPPEEESLGSHTQTGGAPVPDTKSPSADAKQAVIQAALARARSARRPGSMPSHTEQHSTPEEDAKRRLPHPLEGRAAPTNPSTQVQGQHPNAMHDDRPKRDQSA